MQGLPLQFLNQKTLTSAGKLENPIEDESEVASEGEVKNTAEGKAQLKNSFANLFSDLLVSEVSPENSQENSKENTKENMKAEISLEKQLPISNFLTMKLEEFSPEFVENEKTSTVENQKEKKTNDLASLLRDLKISKPEETNQVAPKTASETSPEVVAEKTLNDLGKFDFHIVKNETGEKTSSKLGLSGEDFINQLNMKSKNSLEKTMAQPLMSLEENGIEKNEISKQGYPSVKAYSFGQELFDVGLIKQESEPMLRVISAEIKAKETREENKEQKEKDLKIVSGPFLTQEKIAPMTNKNEQGKMESSLYSDKVLDLSKINPANTNEIIKRISDHVQQNQMATAEKLDLTVKHDSLGHFNIQVNRPSDVKSNQLDMQIITSTPEGHEFFVKNEMGLIKNLSQAGVQLSDLRIISQNESAGFSFSQGDSRQNPHPQSQNGRDSMNFETKDFSHGSERRKELWQEARAHQQRYGA